MTDFSNCRIVPGRAYNGANGNKIAVNYNGIVYMLKFPPSGAGKPTELSYTNSCISEHLSSSIFNLIGIEAQETMLGTYTVREKTKLVCACKDFTTGQKRFFDFCSIKNTVLESDSNGTGTELSDVLDAIDKQQYILLPAVKAAGVFFWVIAKFLIRPSRVPLSGSPEYCHFVRGVSQCFLWRALEVFS